MTSARATTTAPRMQRSPRAQQAAGVSDAVIPWRACWVGPLTHSIFVTDSYNQITQAKPPWDWQTALTWNADALARVNQAIDSSTTALQQPTRQGC